MEKLFGTDGIRSRAGKPPLNIFNIQRILSAYTKYLRENGWKDVVIGSDTRISSHSFRNIICGFLNYQGINAHSLNVFTTPGTAFYSAFLNMPGIVVSASHNPYYDNGLKFFDNEGNKAGIQFEEFIEKEYTSIDEPYTFSDNPEPSCFGTTELITEKADYINYLIGFLKKRVKFDNLSSKKPRVMFDLANGSAVSIRDLFKLIPADSVLANAEPNGYNINDNVGSDYIINNHKNKNNERYDLIIAYDGDADRVTAMDREGFVFNGDIIVAIISIYMSKFHGMQKKIAGTIMTSLAAESMLNDFGFELIRSDVGDRNLKTAMDKKGILLGAESSGHIICRDYLPTGDGVFISILFLLIIYDPYIKSLVKGIKKAYNITEKMQTNHVLKRKTAIGELYSIFKIKFPELNLELINNSMVIRNDMEFYSVVRLSGTEAKIRIYIESADNMKIHVFNDLILNILKEYDIVCT